MIRQFHWAKNILLHNLQLKLISLSLALLLWIALNSEPKSEIGFNLPLEFRNSPGKVEVIGTVDSVEVRVSGSSSLVKRIEASNLSVSIDLSDWSFGERTYTLGESSVSVPFGISVSKITPNKVRLRFEPTEHKIVDIHPKIIGKPQEGYEVTAITCAPNQTQLEGPASHLVSVQDISTDSLDISGRSSNLSSKLHLFVDDPLVRLIGNHESLVEVSIAPKGEETKSGRGN